MGGTERESIIEELKKSYCMELETVTNYLANSIVPDGVRAEEIKKSLAADVDAELVHARQLGERIKQLGGTVPGSLALDLSQQALQPPADTRTSSASSTACSPPKTPPSNNTIGSSVSVRVSTTSRRTWPSG